MKFTLSWLKRHLETDASLEEICDKLTAIGLELESVEDRAAKFAPFKVAYVESAERHPDADKLQVLMVKTEDDALIQVVCGAPNARAGMKGIFAPNGSYIPGLDFKLKKTKIRGVESNGMMVSEKEMELSDEHNGIIEVDDSFDIGTPMAEIYGLDDPIIEIGLTPNRPDCAGVRGIARDLAAAGLGALKPLNDGAEAGSFDSEITVSLNDDGCPHFVGRMIKNVKNGPSPEWLQNLLKSVGLRPISALVDITNFMCLDLARPLHVYDADKLQGNIVVRQAKQGESFDALNDKSYETLGGEIAITDDSGIIGLGGIVGGVSTGCDDDTTNIFIEAAYFSPERIARTGRDLSINSDARYRFERGLDPLLTAKSADVATRLVLELCGTENTEISHITTAGEAIEYKKVISYNPAYTKKLIGVDIASDEQEKTLSALGFEIEKSSHDEWGITPPSWRPDVFGKADITEEVIRISGLDTIPSVSVFSASTVPASAETTLLSRTRIARAALTSRGLHECVTWSFINKDLAKNFGSNDNTALTLSNPISSEMDQMRPSILPNLIEAAGRNAAMSFTDVALCEVGPTFQSSKPDGQSYIAAGIRAGAHGPRHWSDSSRHRAVDLYDAKADAIAVLEACGAPGEKAQVSRDAPEYFHPGRSGALRLGKNVLAYFGEIHPAILDEMDIKGPVVGFEIFLENIPDAKKKGGTEKPYLTLEPLQPLSRDFAFLVNDNVASEDIIRAAKAADKNLIKDVQIFDVYQGKGVEDGKKSVAFSITIQPKGETMTDKDIESLSNNVIALVSEKTGGTLRG